MTKSKPFSLIVAYDEGRVIGCQGKIPWHIPADLKHFKRMTSGNPIVMGRKTYDSLGGPLPNRDHYILSRNFIGSSAKLRDRVWLVWNLEWVADMIQLFHPGKTGWIIGGEQIYRLALEMDVVNRIVATEVKGRHEGDAFFPELGPGWTSKLLEKNELFDIVEYVKE